MLNFALENGNLIYKKREFTILIDNGKIYHSIPSEIVNEMNENIVEYFDNNDFARLLAKLTPAKVEDANIQTIITFLINVENISKELKKVLDKFSKTYYLVLAVRNNFVEENFKVFCLNANIDEISELEAILYNQSPQWFSGYEVEVLPLNNIDDFINKVRE